MFRVIVSVNHIGQACNNVFVCQRRLVCFVKNVFKPRLLTGTKLERVDVLFSCNTEVDMPFFEKFVRPRVGLWLKCEEHGLYTRKDTSVDPRSACWYS